MKTVLVTGVAGFIGSNLVKILLDKGYRVVGVDNFDDTYEKSFKEENIASFAHDARFEMAHLDICDRTALESLFKRTRPALVAHLAAKADARAAIADPDAYVSTNIHGTVNVFEAARSVHAENVVFASSSSVYGNDAQVPWSESASADRPLSPYGATKRAGEMLAHTYHHNFGMNITCLRYFNVYGEHNRPNMVPYLWTEALLHGKEIEMSGKGARKRDYTYVGDAIKATIIALERPLGYELINIGNHHPVSLMELLSLLEKATNSRVRIKERESHQGSVEKTFADISKAKTLLDWEPTTPIEEGVSRLVAWFRAKRL
jgi:UDP-glucuronate 4-epimerase